MLLTRCGQKSVQSAVPPSRTTGVPEEQESGVIEHGNAPSHPLGQWLKKRRRELDLTQEALAARIDCSLATLYKVEAGTRRPSRQIAELLGQALGVPAAQQDAFVRFARQGGLV